MRNKEIQVSYHLYYHLTEAYPQCRTKKYRSVIICTCLRGLSSVEQQKTGQFMLHIRFSLKLYKIGNVVKKILCCKEQTKLCKSCLQ